MVSTLQGNFIEDSSAPQHLFRDASLSFETLSLSEAAEESGASFERSSNASTESSTSTMDSLLDMSIIDPFKYLHLHKQAVEERSEGRCERMQSLYRFWSIWLPANFSGGIYKSFLQLAQEDAAAAVHPNFLGLSCLFSFFLTFLSAQDSLALSTLDYMGLDLGVKCLLEYLSIPEHEYQLLLSGVVLSPSTLSLLEGARKQQQEEAEADPHERLHQRLAEKKSMKSKRRERRDRDRQAGRPISGSGEQKLQSTTRHTLNLPDSDSLGLGWS